MSKMFRISKVAENLSCGKSTVWLYIRQGKLKSIKLSSRVTVVSEDEVKRFIEAQSGGVQTAVENVDAVSPSLAGRGHTKIKRFEAQSGGVQ